MRRVRAVTEVICASPLPARECPERSLRRARRGRRGLGYPLPRLILVQNFFEELKRLVPN